jgi:hypothetical protein
MCSAVKHQSAPPLVAIVAVTVALTATATANGDGVEDTAP